MLLYLITGCLQNIESPNVGQCADPPAVLHDFGQIGIGNCLSGPTDLQFNESGHLLIANANPFQNFSSGSFLAIDWTEVADALMDEDRILIHDLNSSNAISIPSFSSDFALIDNELALVAVRESEDERTRVADDDLWLVEIDDSGQLSLSDKGQNGATVKVGSDPSAMAVSDSEGLAFVGNRTDHTISIIDIDGDRISVVTPWSAAAIPQSSFIDTDNSGSFASMGKLSQITQDMMLDPTQTPADLRDDMWHLKWVEGSYRMWAPEGDGWRRYSSVDGKGFAASSNGIELDPTLSLAAEGVRTPIHLGDIMLFVNGENIQQATWNVETHAWGFSGTPLFSAETEIQGIGYAVGPTSPSLFYTTLENDNWVLRELKETNGVWQEEADPLLSTTDKLGSPNISYDTFQGTWTLTIDVHDGNKWKIEAYRSLDFDTWEYSESRGFQLDEIDVAAPFVSSEPDRFRMWYAFRENAVWNIGYAESSTGTNWQDYGQVLAMEWDDEEPPYAAFSATPTTAFRVEGEQAGVQLGLMEVTTEYRAEEYGWIGAPLAGQWIDLNAFGAASAKSIQLDSMDKDSGLAWLTVTDKAGLSQIAIGEIGEDGSFQQLGIAITPGDEIDSEGAKAPIVWRDEDGFHMLYGAVKNDLTQIVDAHSQDGITWTKGEVRLSVGDNWDSVQLIPDDLTGDSETGYTLWYSAFNGSSWRIGKASSSDGLSWEKSESPMLLPGSAGAFDDASVRDALIVEGESGSVLLYSGFDGADWRIGYATEDENGEFERGINSLTGEFRIVLGESGLFFADGARRIRRLETESGFEYAFHGIYGETIRIGKAWGEQPDRLRPLYRALNNGDELVFETSKGDAEANAIDLDIDIEGMALTGVGLTALHYDEPRGMLFATSKLLPYIIVIDVRDDSTEDFNDKNVMDIEAIFRFSTTSGAVGFRQTMVVGDLLYALNDSPEAVFVIDLSALEDGSYSEIYRDEIKGWLTAPRAAEEDKGEPTRMNIGPGKMVLHPDGKRLFVSQFNANSVTVYDTTIGPNGALIAEINAEAENPYAMAISPDGLQLIVASYAGEMIENTAHSILSVIDIDINSPDYLKVIGKVANR